MRDLSQFGMMPAGPNAPARLPRSHVGAWLGSDGRRCLTLGGATASDRPPKRVRDPRRRGVTLVGLWHDSRVVAAVPRLSGIDWRDDAESVLDRGPRTASQPGTTTLLHPAGEHTAQRHADEGPKVPTRAGMPNRLSRAGHLFARPRVQTLDWGRSALSQALRSGNGGPMAGRGFRCFRVHGSAESPMLDPLVRQPHTDTSRATT